MSGGFVCSDFLELTPKFFNFSKGHKKNINNFKIYGITDIVGYPKHFTEDKYLHWILEKQYFLHLPLTKMSHNFMLDAPSSELS